MLSHQILVRRRLRTTLVREGAMTDRRKALCDWINDTVEGKTWKRMLTITELLSVDGGVKDGKAYQMVSAFPIRVKFPFLSVNNVEGNVQEEVEFFVIRLESDLLHHW